MADTFHSMLHCLAYRADKTPNTVAYTFNEEVRTYGSLWADIRRFASILEDNRAQPGDRVLIVMPNGHDFFTAFYGIQLLGAIAVPIFPQMGMTRIVHMARLCDAACVVIDSRLSAEQQAQAKLFAQQNNIQVLTATTDESVPSFEGALPDQHTTAFIQYTSGSTGDPKGVMLTHHNLITNIKQMIVGMEITSDEHFVSWLPVYHDMGLILKTMVPFYLQTSLTLLPTDLQNPARWLATIEDAQATFTAAPDFAYRLCIRRFEPGSYDLSSLRVALNAAEFVRASSISKFESHFNLHPGTMVAGYGLAEATVGVSMMPPNTPPRVDANGNVSVGKLFPDIQCQILDEHNHTLIAGEIGEIVLNTPAATKGYLNNPSATEGLYYEGKYIRTGDLGHLDREGYLTIVGRKKDVIIRMGQTLSPREIEEIIDPHPLVRYSAAFGATRSESAGEQVIICAEVQSAVLADTDKLHALSISIVQMIHAQLGFRPGHVLLLKPKSIPLTYNGKKQYTKLKDAYEDRTLSSHIVYP